MKSSHPGSPEHIRGFFFEVFPRLSVVEKGRRPDRSDIEIKMDEAGFSDIRTAELWETRKRHDDASALAADLRKRTGRSILHELSDDELEDLVQHILAQFLKSGPVTERDRWTLWWGYKAP